MNKSEKETQFKCPTCGKFVSEYDGFYTPATQEHSDLIVMVCCDEECAEKYLGTSTFKGIFG